MASPVIIHFLSALPMLTKKNNLPSQMLRALRVSSPGLPRARSLKMVEELFIKSGYPPHLIARPNNEILRRGTVGWLGPDRSVSAPPVYLVLPFVDDDLCRKTEGIIRASHLDFRIAWKGGQSLKTSLWDRLTSVPCPGAG